MCRNATSRVLGAILVLQSISISGLLAQTAGMLLEWRRIGSTSMDLALPSLATGPVTRVWYSPTGDSLFARTRTGQVWETQDFENWKLTNLRAAPPKNPSLATASRPEANVRVERSSGSQARYYALGRFVYRSDDGGSVWNNVTGFRNQSILGEGLTDLAVSPREPEEITVSGDFGVWRSMDGGVTWSGLNQGLPNLPARKLLELPNGLSPVRVAAPLADGSELQLEWAPGERTAWRAAEHPAVDEQSVLRQQISQKLGVTIQTVTLQGTYQYAGSADGRLYTSPDSGQTWEPSNLRNAGPVNAIWVNAKNPRIAIAALGSGSTDAVAARVVRTYNGGQFWDDLSANLPLTSANGVVADPLTGSIYAATDFGVFYTTTDLANLVPSSGWQRISGGLIFAPALDVRLDENANQLFVLLQGHGVFAAMAPHRLRELNIVNAADFTDRAAAPGALLSILGRRLESVRTGDLNVPVLASTSIETQVQVPFEATGDTLPLILDAAGNTRSYPLAPVSPAIFIDRDGAPLLLEANEGVALDAMNPARSGARIQILATGMGAVNPAWPAGVPAPVDNIPSVVAPVRVFLDREPVEVTRATLAPRHIGFYLIEIQLPKLVNAGPAELYIEAGSKQSNRVRLYLAP